MSPVITYLLDTMLGIFRAQWLWHESNSFGKREKCRNDIICLYLSDMDYC